MNDHTILSDRLAMLDTLSLNAGKHDSFDAGHSAMELVSWLAGEPFSDAPQCACPTITAFVVSWNNGLPSDAERNRLIRPLLPCVIGTRSTAAIAARRCYLALDWLIRVYTPKWLDLVESLQPHAQRLRDLGEIVDLAGAIGAGRLTVAARNAAWDAAEAAAWDTAGDAAGAAAWYAALDAALDAAWDAARAAAGAAAWSAARAAVAAPAGDAAGAAARHAAWAAAWSAGTTDAWAAGTADARDAALAAAGHAARAAGTNAGDALQPTTAWLQASASELLRRMCALDSRR